MTETHFVPAGALWRARAALAVVTGLWAAASVAQPAEDPGPKGPPAWMGARRIEMRAHFETSPIRAVPLCTLRVELSWPGEQDKVEIQEAPTLELPASLSLVEHRVNTRQLDAAGSPRTVQSHIFRLKALAPGKGKLRVRPAVYRLGDDDYTDETAALTVQFEILPATKEEEKFAFHHVCMIVGGLALFLYGMNLASDGLKKAAGGRMKALLELLTRNRVAGLLVGTIVTLILQSSSATSVMLVGLVNAGLMVMEQSIAVLLGAGIGTTLTIQIIAFNLADYALLVVAVGVPLVLLRRSRSSGYLGRMLIGFGLVFYGMGVMKSGVEPLKGYPEVVEWLAYFGDRPVLAALAATVVTAIIQSSAATIAFAMTLATAGLLQLPAAIALILGANIGTTATAILSCFGASRAAWRVALVHLTYKVLGVALILPLIEPFAALVGRLSELTGADEARQIANAHTLFNVGTALVLLPLTGVLAWFIRKLIPARRDVVPRQVRFIDPQTSEDTYTSLLKAAKEVQHMGQLATNLVGLSLDAFDRLEHRIIDELERRDSEIDLLYRAILRYLNELSGRGLSAAETARQTRLLYLAKDLEQIGDLASRDLQRLALKKMRSDADFSMEAFAQLRRYHVEILHEFEAVVTAIDGEAEARAPLEALQRRSTAWDDRFRSLLRDHFERVQQGVAEAAESDAIFTDVLGTYRAVHQRVLDMAHLILEIESPDAVGHDAPQAAPEDPVVEKPVR